RTAAVVKTEGGSQCGRIETNPRQCCRTQPEVAARVHGSFRAKRFRNFFEGSFQFIETIHDDLRPDVVGDYRRDLIFHHFKGLVAFLNLLGHHSDDKLPAQVEHFRYFANLRVVKEPLHHTPGIAEDSNPTVANAHVRRLQHIQPSRRSFLTEGGEILDLKLEGLCLTECVVDGCISGRDFLAQRGDPIGRVVLYIRDVDDVIAELAFNYAVNQPWPCRAEYGILKRFHHIARAEPTQVAATCGRAGILADLARLRSKVSATAQFAKYAFRFGTGSGFCSVGVVGPLNQNMSRTRCVNSVFRDGRDFYNAIATSVDEGSDDLSFHEAVRADIRRQVVRCIPRIGV